MPSDEFVLMAMQRDQAAALLALVGIAFALIVCATPRRWRQWVLGAMAIYALVTSRLVNV